MVGPITVAILDADVTIRQRLRVWLEATGGIAIVGEGKDEQEVLGQTLSRPPQVLLADLGAVGEAAGVARVIARFPGTRLIILHDEAEGPRLLEALQQGARGHLAKGALRPEAVVEAIRAVARGEAYLSPNVAGRIVEKVAHTLREGNVGNDPKQEEA